MTSGTRPWQVRLTAVAEADFQDILRWTLDHFGAAQARAYAGVDRIRWHDAYFRKDIGHRAINRKRI